MKIIKPFNLCNINPVGNCNRGRILMLLKNFFISLMAGHMERIVLLLRIFAQSLI